MVENAHFSLWHFEFSFSNYEAIKLYPGREAGNCDILYASLQNYGADFWKIRNFLTSPIQYLNKNITVNDRDVIFRKNLPQKMANTAIIQNSKMPSKTAVIKKISQLVHMRKLPGGSFTKRTRISHILCICIRNRQAMISPRDHVTANDMNTYYNII